MTLKTGVRIAGIASKVAGTKEAGAIQAEVFLLSGHGWVVSEGEGFDIRDAEWRRELCCITSFDKNDLCP